MIANLQGLPEADQETVWNLVEKWAAKETGEGRKATLRERIRLFAFVRRSVKQGVTAETRSRARKAYDMLTPADVVTKHLWLFEKQWVQESYDELEEPDFDYTKREEKSAMLALPRYRKFGSPEDSKESRRFSPRAARHSP